MNSRIIFNITTSADWHRRPVGIIRVERELAKQLISHFQRQLVAVYLDRGNQKFKTLPTHLLGRILSDEWVSVNDPDNAEKILPSDYADFQPEISDKFISVGSDWSFNVPDVVKNYYPDSKNLIAALYDLIPLRFPELTPGPEFYEQFLRHYKAIAEIGMSVFSISENSKHDLNYHWQKNELAQHAPKIEVIPLAGLDIKYKLPELNKQETNAFDSIVKGNSYIIYVSTLEPRKNHQLLLDLWRELYAKRGASCPRLLIIGMRGWGCNEMIEMMTRMQAYTDGYILWKEGLGDNILMHLYSNALFSVFPSVYEGWGLAATEALTFGKVCLVSNSSSLDEATQGLCPSLHPFDFPSWLNEIEKLVDDEEYRHEIEQKICQKHACRTWSDFGKDFIEKLILDR